MDCMMSELRAKNNLCLQLLRNPFSAFSLPDEPWSSAEKNLPRSQVWSQVWSKEWSQVWSNTLLAS